MKSLKAITFICVLLLGLGVGANAIAADNSYKNISGRYGAIASIVVVDKDNQPLRAGTGFFTGGERGEMVTSYRLLRGSKAAKVRTVSGESGKITEVIKSAPGLDLVVVRTTIKGAGSVNLGNSDKIKPGAKITLLSRPTGKEIRVAEGLVTALRNSHHKKVFELSLPIEPAASGAPLYNTSGEVVAMATQYSEFGKSYGYAVPINNISKLNIIPQSFGELKASELDIEPRFGDKPLVKAHRLRAKSVLYDSQKRRTLTALDLAITNKSDFIISDIEVFFIYKNLRGRVIGYSTETFAGPIPPGLGAQFIHTHRVDNWASRYSRYVHGRTKVRVLNYKMKKSEVTPPSPEDLLYR